MNRPGPAMRITRGLAPFQVLQRDDRGRAAVTFSGEARAEGVVWARALGRPDGWRRAGLAHDGMWEARLEGLPVGGPYRIEAEIRGMAGRPARRRSRALARIAVPGILVGDLWILAGQSNMEGVGVLRDVETPHPLVHNLEMGGAWTVAREPLHWLPESPDSVHWWGMNETQRNEFVKTYRATRDRGAGPGLPFAKRLVEATGVPVGLLPTAHGGTNMEQWSPAKRDEGGRSLYGSLDRTVRAAGGRVVMKEIPVPRWSEIRDLQRLAETRLPRLAMVPSIDLPLDDAIHLSTPGHITLGGRLAVQALRLVFGKPGMTAGPRPLRARIEGPKRDRIRLRLRGVNGRLLPARNIRGFSVRDARGQDLELVFEAKLESGRRDEVIILVREAPPKGAVLWYGYGLDPVCTLIDAKGMPAPAFGPLPIT